LLVRPQSLAHPGHISDGLPQTSRSPRRNNPFQQRADDRARATAQQDLTLHECAGRFDPLCQLRHGARRVCVALPREPNCVDVQAAEDHAATGRLAPSA
jgi:hypothetical protein